MPSIFTHNSINNMLRFPNSRVIVKELGISRSYVTRIERRMLMELYPAKSITF
jgi:hypothetical protein